MAGLAERARRGVALAFSLFVVVACKSPGSGQGGEPRPEQARLAAPRAVVADVAPVAFEPGNAERGKALLGEFQCQRCHEGTGLAAPALDQDCVGCHEQIATDKFNAAPSKLAKWKPHIMAYRDVPSLTALGGRVRPSWLMQYLQSPHDLRPGLAPTMPRLALSAEQARDIATYLTLSESAPVTALHVPNDSTRIGRGRELMAARGCVTCHEMSGSGLASPPAARPAPRAQGLAPDLRFARQRSEPGVIMRWLLDPAKIKHDTAMPNLALSADDARDLAAFLSFAELMPDAKRPEAPRLALLERRVGFDEVNEKVFAVTCRHCHTNPDSANGDGGPGNTGGFGFKPRKIDFSSYQGIQRVSLFTPMSDGVPRLVAALVARRREEAGHMSDEVRGMPLGLPPLSPEQIQLVESWVAQGRPL
jgi:cytochrome c5